MYTKDDLVRALDHFGGGCPVLINGAPITGVTIQPIDGDEATNAVNLEVTTGDPLPVEPVGAPNTEPVTHE